MVSNLVCSKENDNTSLPTKREGSGMNTPMNAAFLDWTILLI